MPPRQPDDAEFARRYVLRAIDGRGALTSAGVAEHCRFRGAFRKLEPVLQQLVADGNVERFEVEDGGPAVFVSKTLDWNRAPPSTGVLLCPFDNLLWDRPFAQRVLGFKHLIEVYKREHERRFGYYVLPLVLGDQLVRRADLKAERSERTLHVLRFHVEEGVRRTGARVDALEAAASRLARAIDLDRVEIQRGR